MIRNFGPVSGLSASPPGLDMGFASPGGTFPTWKAKNANGALQQWAYSHASNTLALVGILSDGSTIVTLGGSFIRKLDKNGAQVWTTTISTLAPTPTALAIGSDDSIYFVFSSANSIAKVNPNDGTLTFLTTTVTANAVIIRFNNGFLYVGETNGFIRKIDPANPATPVWSVQPNINQVNDIHFDSSGNVWVAGNQGGAVNFWKLNPANGGVLSSYNVTLDTNSATRSFVIDSNNDLYCTTGWGTGKIYKLTAASGYNTAAPQFTLTIANSPTMRLFKSDVDEFLAVSDATVGGALIRFDKTGAILYSMNSSPIINTLDYGSPCGSTAPAYQNGAFIIPMIVIVASSQNLQIRRYVDKINF